MINGKPETFEQTLEYQKQLLLQTQLTMAHQQRLEKQQWYDQLIGLLAKAHIKTSLELNLTTNDPQDFEEQDLLVQYRQALSQLQSGFLAYIKQEHKTFLAEKVSRHVVGNKAVLIRDEEIRRKMLATHMNALTEWVNHEISKLVIDKNIFAPNKQYQDLVKQRTANEKELLKLSNQLEQVTRQVQALDESLISDTRDLWQDVVEFYQIEALEDYLSVTRERNTQPVDARPDDTKSAKQVLQINPCARPFEELRSRVCKFLSHLYQKEDYIKQYTENKFFRLMIEIIEGYTIQEHTRLRSNGYINQVVGFFTVNESVKKERYGEVELIIAIIDLAVKKRISQQDIDSTLSRLVANARRGIRGTISSGSLATRGKSSFHDKVSQLINLLHTNEAITRFGQSYDLHEQQIKVLQTKLSDVEKAQEAQGKQLGAVMQWLLSQQTGQPFNIQGLLQQGVFQSSALQTAVTQVANVQHTASNSQLITDTRSGAQFRRHAINPDGDSGYTALGIKRADAHQILSDHLMANRERLRDVVAEQLAQPAFVRYLIECGTYNEDLQQINEVYCNTSGPANTEALAKLRGYADDLVVLQAYLDYDVRDKKVDAGWAHPAILQVLAHIQGIELYIWCLAGNGQLQPHVLYSHYKPSNIKQRVELLFGKDNHLERLEKLENEATEVLELEEAENAQVFKCTYNA
jgi:hypothetical protein